jgi:hypothetical protein
MVLLYANPASDPSEFWNTEDLKWAVSHCDPDGVPRDRFFDGFLVTGFGCRGGGRHLLGLKTCDPATVADWDRAIETYLVAVERLSDACKTVTTQLGLSDPKARVIVAIPYPDPRDSAFGPVDGGSLDLSDIDAQFELVRWYVDTLLAEWKRLEGEGRLQGVRLAGLFWGKEGIWERDIELVGRVADYIHSRDLLAHWIPCFNGARPEHLEIGLDCLTQQINYQNPEPRDRPLTIFEDRTRIARSLGLHGVEMTPMARSAQLNRRVWSWHQVHLANLEAALRLDWADFPAITYFHANDLPFIGADADARIFYDKLHRWVRRELTWDDLAELCDAVLHHLKTQGVLSDLRLKKIDDADQLLLKVPILEKLYLMEKPEELIAAERAEPEPTTVGS